VDGSDRDLRISDDFRKLLSPIVDGSSDDPLIRALIARHRSASRRESGPYGDTDKHSHDDVREDHGHAGTRAPKTYLASPRRPVFLAR
jgi:hypothetical protein